MIKFLDLHKINQRFKQDLELAFANSLEASNFILGKNVEKFENEFAAYCCSKYALGTANGLDALTLILKGYIALGKLEKGDKVIVPANTFIATILSVIHAGLEPVLVEPDPKTYNLSLSTVKERFTDDIKAIIMVHLYGQLAEVDAINKFAKDRNILCLEDAAQAHGAACNNGKAGDLSDAAAFSFYPSKNLGALGDGGAVTTNNLELYNSIKLLRNYGSSAKYENEVIGFNSRLDDMQAAFLNIKLKRLNLDNERRRTIASSYLKGIDNPKINLPFYDNSKAHVFYAFVVEVNDRNDFMTYLSQNSIESLIHYPIPPHKQNALTTFSHLNLPITEKIHKRIISLPISPVMTDAEVKHVIKVINNY